MYNFDRTNHQFSIANAKLLLPLFFFALALTTSLAIAQKPEHEWIPAGDGQGDFVQELPEEWTAEGHTGSIAYGVPETNPAASSPVRIGGPTPEPSSLVLGVIAGFSILRLRLRRTSSGSEL